MGEIFSGAPFLYRDFPPVGKRLEHHKQIGDPLAGVFIIIDRRLPRLDGAGLPRFLDELPVGFVNAYHRLFLVIWELVDL
jgi:hypothetical protein